MEAVIVDNLFNPPVTEVLVFFYEEGKPMPRLSMSPLYLAKLFIALVATAFIAVIVSPFVVMGVADAIIKPSRNYR